MAVLEILEAPDPRLKKVATPVPAVDDAVRRLMDDMVDTMHAANGIGLAAPQVGVLKRVLIVHVDDPDAELKTEPLRMANPEIVWASDDVVVCEEGCLSLPEQYAEVGRPNRVRVRYLDYDNKVRELDAEGLQARCIQHEIDHLEGVLFVDYLSALKRNMILRKLSKAKRARLDEAV